MYKCRSCDSKLGKIFKSFERNETVDIKASGSSPLSTDLWKCNNCGLISQHPEHPKDYVEMLYKNENDETFVLFNEARIHSFKRIVSKLIKNNIIYSNSNGADIGCAGGAFPQAAKELGIDVIGIEPSVFLSSYAKKNYNLNIKNGYFKEVKDQIPDMLDLITLWDVIEHVYDLNDLISDIDSKLKSNGNLILNTPIINSLPALLLGKKWPMLLDVHLHYFNEKSLTYLLRKHGYQLKYKTHYYQTLPLGYVLKRGFDFLLHKETNSQFYSYKFPVTYYIGQKCFVFSKN